MRTSILCLSFASMMAMSSSAHAFFGSDVVLKKDHPPLEPTWVEKNDNEVLRSVYEIELSAQAQVDTYLEEHTSLLKLRYVDLETIDTIKPLELPLAYDGIEAKSVRTKYATYINTIVDGIEAKRQLRRQEIAQKELEQTNNVAELAQLEANRTAYVADMQVVYDERDSTIQKLADSEQRVKDLSAQLATFLNGNAPLKKALKDKHFEKPKMKEGNCEQPVETKSTSIAIGQSVEGFCFTAKISVEKGSSEAFAQNSGLMSAVNNAIAAIGQEKMNQGASYNKSTGRDGYKQQIKSYRYGGIRDAEIAAKEKYGSTEKGLGFAIERLTKTNNGLANSIKRLQQNLASNAVSDYKRNQNKEQLKAVYGELEIALISYLDASFEAIIGEPVQQSDENYLQIELSEFDGLLLVKDTYPASKGLQREVFLINTHNIVNSKAIQKHFDGKPISTRAAAGQDGLLLWQGAEANYPRIAKSVRHFLEELAR
ncbi:hypothetical protein K0504_12955 [Neiella marina]|uniref:Uncharacterized protein n=1 Tax=Neiella holothuriorum TaxID=2870530 RepID=A0ABS7EJ94_9GAMM|nr:hypothetical protein [Neiella holothuriorum]MBW8191948.1 hypothetical protein [Neiella holothuriorum]